MSEAEDLVRDVFSRWNEGERDFNPDLFDSSFTIHSALTADVYEGMDGMEKWVAEIDDQFQDWNLVLEDTKTLAGERVLASGEIQMTGRQSGVAFQQAASWLFEFKEGRMSSVYNFIGRDAAAEFARGEP